MGISNKGVPYVCLNQTWHFRKESIFAAINIW